MSKTKKRKKIPIRTCVGCGESKPKRELLRIVRTPERKVIVDCSGRLNGRGTYICYSQDCVKLAIGKDKIDYVLEISMDQDSQEQLKKDILRVINNKNEAS